MDDSEMLWLFLIQWWALSLPVYAAEVSDDPLTGLLVAALLAAAWALWHVLTEDEE